MSDILTDRDLYKKASRWIKPFRRDRVRSASYDISAGDTLIIAYSPKVGGRRHISLRSAKQEKLKPGLMAILFSFQTFNIPSNIQAKISLRSDFSTRGLFFAGGIIDPGFSGRELWLPIANLSTREIPIEYDQPMFRVEFTRLSKKVLHPYAVGKIEIDEEDMPKLPDEPVYNIAQISERLGEYDIAGIDNRLKIVETKAQLFEPSTTIVQGFFIAAIAGIVAGAAFAGIRAIEDDKTSLAAGIGVAVVAVSFLAYLLLHLFKK